MGDGTKCEAYGRPCENLSTKTVEDGGRTIHFCDDCYRRCTNPEYTYVWLEFPTPDPSDAQKWQQGKEEFIESLWDTPGLLDVEESENDGLTWISFKFDAEDVKEVVEFTVALEKLLGKKVTFVRAETTN